jgi:ABC-type uncharacterized transport system permease subunit
MKRTWVDETIKYVVILAIALVIGSLLIIARGEDPIQIGKLMLTRGFGTRSGIANILRYATPVIITGLAAAIAFRVNIGNVGVEGQLYVGSLVASILAYSLTSFAPLPLKVFSILGGMAAGAAFAMIPAFLLVKWGVNEILSTLMLNYVAQWGTEYVVRTFLMGWSTSKVPLQIATQDILPGAHLEKLMPPYDVNSALIYGIILCILFFLLYRFTRLGYILNTLGGNKRFARYGGINITWMTYLVFGMSGFVGALGGISEILGVQGKFINSFSNGIGWNGLLVSLIAKNNPIGVIFAGLFWGILQYSGILVEQNSNVDRWTFYVVEAVIVLLVTADLYLRPLINRLKEKRSQTV